MMQVFQTVDEAALAAAGHVADLAAEAIEAHGRARIAVSGGRTPAALYRALCASPLRERVDWSRVDLLFADERAVAPDDPESNLKLVRDTLLAGLEAPGPSVQRMRADDPDVAAALAEYERALEAPLDILLLGMGPDGHTASLFPGSALLRESSRRVAMVEDSPKPPSRRMTILPRVIAEARTVLMLVSGADKSRMMARALDTSSDALSCPASLAREGDWFMDQGAASAFPVG